MLKQKSLLRLLQLLVTDGGHKYGLSSSIVEELEIILSKVKLAEEISDSELELIDVLVDYVSANNILENRQLIIPNSKRKKTVVK